MEKDINYYTNLPYTKILIKDEDGSVFAKIEELHGCMTVGDDEKDALEMLEDALHAWIEIALETGKEIPEPQQSAPPLNDVAIFEPMREWQPKWELQQPMSIHIGIEAPSFSDLAA